MSMQLTIFEYIKTEKRCCKCKEVKPVDKFCKNKSRKDGFNVECRQCLYFYYENNKEFITQRRKGYYKKHKESILHKSVVYQRHRLNSDPLFRVIHNIRGRVTKFCKSVSMQKNWQTLDAMCCTREEFKEYFESLFTEGMTWENYGAWHVDHIKPISLATTEQEAIQLSHYTNLQPLWAEDNLRKSNKYD